MLKRILLYTVLSVSLLGLVDASRGDVDTQAQILEHSRKLSKSSKYLAALEVLDAGMELYPKDEQISEEFKKNTQLYVVHQIAVYYARLEKDPHDIEAYVSLANLFLLMNDRFEALRVLTEGTFVNQTSGALWQEIAKVEIISGRSLEAQSALREAQRYGTSKQSLVTLGTR
ncbi:MAG: hypothetical protein V4534_05510 [Myxococcota bacterium]